MLGKRIINTGAAGTPATPCTTDTVQILDGVPFDSIATYELESDAANSVDTGYIGKSAVFNGSSSGINLPSSTPISNQINGTVSLWFNVLNNTKKETLIRFANNDEVLLRINTNGTLDLIGVRQSNNSYISYTTTGSYNDGAWHHLVMTRESGSIKFYINNSLDNTLSWNNTFVTAANDSAIGWDGYSTASILSGKIDEVRIYNTALTAGNVATLYAETASSTISISGLQAHYKFEGDATDETGSYDGTASNVSYNEYDGTATNVTYAAGQFGNAAVFNGSSSKVDLPNFMPSGNAPRSVSMWIKTTTTAYSSLLRYGVGATNNYFLFRVNTGNKLGVAFWANDYDVDVSSTGLFDGNWHQVAMTYDGATIRLYVDGAEQGSGYNAGSTNTTASAVRLGYQANPDGSSSSSYFNGSIDQVRIYDKAISAANVAELYSETLATSQTNISLNTPSGVAYYKMNDATDETGSYDGTATNVNFNVAGKFGNAGEFNGSSSEIQVLNNVLNINTISISAWINLSTTSGFQQIVSNYSSSNTGWGLRINNGGFLSYNTAVSVISSSTALSVNTWYHVAVTIDSSGNSTKLYINGSEDSSTTFTAATYGAGNTNFHIGSLGNINTQYFNGKIDQVRIFDRAITSDEVETLYNEVYCQPTIVPTEHFEPVIYTGTSGTQSITSLDFQPDFTWIKSRSNITSHVLSDSVRGANLKLRSNSTGAEAGTDYGVVTSFDSNGFTVGGTIDTGDVSFLNRTYVAWNWKAGGAAVTDTSGTITSQVSASTDAGFSIVDWTTTSSTNQRAGHGLSATPELIIHKQLNNTSNWYAFTTVIDSSYDYLLLNTTAAKSDASSSDLPTSTTFSTQNFSSNWISYCFHSVDGMSKIGSYVGTNTRTGIVTGFRPAFVMIKRTDASSPWFIIDNRRFATYQYDKYLLADSSAIEGALGSTQYVSFLSNGFSVETGSGLNGSGNSYIFMAFAEENVQPEPELANSFNVVTYTGNGSTQAVTGLGFKPDLVWVKSRDASHHHVLVDSVRGSDGLYGRLFSSLTSAENTTSTDTVTNISTDGFTVNSAGSGSYVNDSSTDYVAWAWKASNDSTINNDGSTSSVVSANPASGFSVVEYTAGGAATVGHGLSQAPELIITKNLDISEQWFVYAEPVGTQKFLGLNTTSAATSNSGVYTNIGADTFTNNISGTSRTYINYCFHSVDGYQKIGSYTGTGASNSIVTGFRPAFVMTKKTNNTGSWTIIDNKRDSSNPIEKFLKANDSTSEGTASNYADFNSNGFTLKTSSGNNSGDTFIYLAIA